MKHLQIYTKKITLYILNYNTKIAVRKFVTLMQFISSIYGCKNTERPIIIIRFCNKYLNLKKSKGILKK